MPDRGAPQLAGCCGAALVNDLATLTLWLAALAARDKLTASAVAIREVARCWP